MSLTLIYDGGCPFCRHFALRSELTSGIPDLEIRDGRSEQALRQTLRRRGMNLANGAVLLEGDQAWHGSAAIAELSRRMEPGDPLLQLLQSCSGRCSLNVALPGIAACQACFARNSRLAGRPRSRVDMTSSGIEGPSGPTVDPSPTDLLKHRLRSCLP